jgi:hypothetical protein
VLSRCGEARVEIKPNIDRAVSAAQSGRAIARRGMGLYIAACHIGANIGMGLATL